MHFALTDGGHWDNNAGGRLGSMAGQSGPCRKIVWNNGSWWLGSMQGSLGHR